MQPYSLLAVIGQGAHRLSEIAGRLGKPAAGLSRPLSQLVDLGCVRRETPFGEDPRSSKRSLYKLADPFLTFYFRFVEPNKSQLEVRPAAAVMTEVARRLPQHVSLIWEQLARAGVPSRPIAGCDWGEARRWWGADMDGGPRPLAGRGLPPAVFARTPHRSRALGQARPQSPRRGRPVAGRSPGRLALLREAQRRQDLREDYRPMSGFRKPKVNR